MNTPVHTRGFGILEVLVALTLSLLLILMALSVLISNKTTYKLVEAQSRIQESLDFSLNFMVKDIVMAGHFGCGGRTKFIGSSLDLAPGDGSLLDVGMLNTATDTKDSTYRIEGIDAIPRPVSTWSPSLEPSGLPLTTIPDTDAIMVKYFDPTKALPLTVDMTNNDSTLTVAPNDMRRGDIVAVSDCDYVDIFQITADPSLGAILHLATGLGVQAPGNATGDLRKIYTLSPAAEPPVVMPYVGVFYYVATGAGGRPSLWRGAMPLAGTDRLRFFSQEMIEGVESLQFLYGIDTSNNGFPDSYAIAGSPDLDQPAEWDNVVAVKIGLLVANVEEYGVEYDTFAHNVLDVIVPAKNDRRQRRVIQTLVRVRN